jgi:hypothetical protein
MRGLSPVSARTWLAVILTLACAVVGACASRSAGSAWNVEGPIRAIDGPVWVVGDRLVTIAPDARIVGSPAIGSVAQVHGTRNEHGSPIGESVEIIGSSQATTQPTATSAPPTPASTATVPQAAPPQAPVTAPPPAPTANPAIQPGPQAEPGRDGDDDKKDKEEKERRGPPAKPGAEQKPAGKPKGR